MKRTLLRLGSAYALAWVCTSMVAGPGSAAVVALTGRLDYAGLFIAFVYLGGALGAMLGGRAMDRFGRRPPLIAAYLVAATGYGLAGLAVHRGSAWTFGAAAVTFAAAFGAVNLTRLAAAEMFPPHERGRGVSWVQISAIFGAVAGPLLLLASDPLGRALGRPPLELVWYLAPPLLLVAAWLVWGAMEPRVVAAAVAPDPAGEIGAAPATIANGARLATAGVVSLAASQAAMAAVMGVAGAAVAHAGHGVNVLGGVMFLHFIGMFGLSRFVGTFADRVGRRATILAGLALLAGGGATVALVHGTVGFAVGLLLVGLGWSFGFIGATVLLTDVTEPARRARVLGRADRTAQLASAVVALGGGWWFASHGVAGLGVVAIAVAAAPVLLVLLLREPAPGQFAPRPT